MCVCHIYHGDILSLKAKKYIISCGIYNSVIIPLFSITFLSLQDTTVMVLALLYQQTNVNKDITASKF